MAIPTYEDIMLPLLELIADGNEHEMRQLVGQISDRMGLTSEERSQLLASGRRRVIEDRSHWSRHYLIKAGLVEPIRRGWIRITPAGKELIARKPARVDKAFLIANYPALGEYLDSVQANRGSRTDSPAPVIGNDQTPEETLEEAYLQLRNELADELLSTVKEMSPQSFERLVVELLVKMGYGGSLKDAGQAVGKTADGGIDGIIKEDRLGLDTIFLQAKRYTDQSVGRPAIQEFVGALQGFRARKGVFITTSHFSSTAVDYVKHIDTKVVLIDGRQLVEYMIDFDLGVTRANVFEVKRLDSDYFEDV